jgi:hypothetical protein
MLSIRYHPSVRFYSSLSRRLVFAEVFIVVENIGDVRPFEVPGGRA